jgi:hypothetical protein
VGPLFSQPLVFLLKIIQYESRRLKLRLNRRHPWSTFAVFQTTVTSWSLAYDVVLGWLWWHVTADLQPNWRLIARIVGYLWIFLFCRLIKYTEHFCRYPADLVYVPLIPIFGYYHSIWIKLHAMLTLQVVRIESTFTKKREACLRLLLQPNCQKWTPVLAEPP